MRRDLRDLAALVSTEKGVKALVSYVNKTWWLSPAKGEFMVS
jgi:hypothetical protein